MNLSCAIGHFDDGAIRGVLQIAKADSHPAIVTSAAATNAKAMGAAIAERYVVQIRHRRLTADSAIVSSATWPSALACWRRYPRNNDFWNEHAIGWWRCGAC
jgi:hypothetical protein